jgi:hypothetical protein
VHVNTNERREYLVAVKREIELETVCKEDLHGVVQQSRGQKL